MTVPLSAPFFIACTLIAAFMLNAWNHRRAAWGLPAMAVLITIAGWYIGDALYNDYARYQAEFDYDVLETAWWQVVIFVVTFGIAFPRVHRSVNRRYLRLPSHIMMMAGKGFLLNSPVFKRRMEQFFYATASAWLILCIIAMVRTDYDWQGYFFPWLGRKVNPWARHRVGDGISALLSLASYSQVFVTAAFGIFLALLKNGQARILALAAYLLTSPFFFFDRTRNTMLAVLIPGLVAWIFLRLRFNLVIKLSILLLAILLVDGWMRFVMEHRTRRSIAEAFAASDDVSSDTRHSGLKMFSELLYIETFIRRGTYTPNWGYRYYSELVNPIPRALWPSKPAVGLDYAFARGFGKGDVTDSDGGVTASIATGIIGQGIVNFGSIAGPVVAALLISIWGSILARQDLLGSNPARLVLFATGMIFTFNMGRDITILVLCPFLIGWLLVRFQERLMTVPKKG